MKILYLGHFLEGSSWSTVAIENLKALSLYAEVNWRPVVINPKKYPNEIAKLSKHLSKIDACIQHVIPAFMQKGDIPSIGFFEQETDSVRYTGWQERLDIMDQVWVPNKKHLQPDYKLIRHPVDLKKYKKDYPKPNFEKDQYIFYTIGELNRRKRLSAVIEAFHLAFNENDNATLVIKSFKHGYDPNFVREELEKTNDLVKKSLGLSGYKDPIFITENLSDEQILGLHQASDCYINASFGEAYCIPIIDALGFNRNIITSDVVDYVREHVISGRMENCVGAEQYVQNLHSGREKWMSVSILEMSEKMREVYDNSVPPLVHDLSEFSYESVGKKMYDSIKELL